ncbi:S-formylglutathione hydrolase-like protein [Dinothrombium tinctorium]|uniref:S-formylglutathione hydrolase n=1 Tax=Dinothrombium tinctorium TaxID=1965070 RepID=A0A3S4RHI0_9ACAR|nr:S-formylglutathione hydrolase-like protein [Dinothrombium tinctorium]RWS16244.1 S-formylglutathione hydrolase-like protein [Dinothrombium tinctorium]
MSLKQVSSAKSFGGYQKVFAHKSKELDCEMKFSLYVPPAVEDGHKVPVLYWLSGLTCTEENFIIKSGFQRYAAQYKICVVGPDTSPRGCGIEGEDDDWDFGTGAGFYVDASEEKWKKHYRMYSYVTKELPDLIEKNFDFVIAGKRSISGHSMGGHGAIISALKNPGFYMCATAFAPISNPTQCPWGKKAFSGYLGNDEQSWQQWDATHLVTQYNGPYLHLLIDQGSADPFLKDQLLCQNLVKACAKAKIPVVYREQEGYDHSYFFVGTFIEDHFKHHSKILYS